MADSSLKIITQPELVIGLAAPVGVDLTLVEDGLKDCLRSVNYRHRYIKISAQMQDFKADIQPSDRADFYSDTIYKMDYATELCRSRNDPAFLAAIAVRAVRNHRFKLENGEPSVPEGMSYIISQFKRPDEIKLLRTVYGKQFIFVSAYATLDARQNRIARQIKSRISSELTTVEIDNLARKFMLGTPTRIWIITGNTFETLFIWLMYLSMPLIDRRRIIQ